MVPGALRIELHPEGQHLEVVLAGELDAASSPALQQRLADVPADCDQVILDLAAVTFMDSTGIAEIIRTAQRLDPARRVVRVRNPNPHVERLLELTGLTDLLRE